MSLPSSRQTVAALLAVLLVLGISGGVDAVGGQDPRARRDEVRQRRSQTAAELDVLKANQAEVERALDVLDANVAAEQAKLADAQRAATKAEEALAQAQQAEADAEARLARLEQQVRDAAVEAFVNQGQGLDELTQSDPNEFALREALVSASTDRNFDVLDQLEAARQELEAQREAAQQAAQAAEERRAAVANQLAEVESARSQHAAVVADVQARVERKLSEVAVLAQQDAQLSKELEAAQRALAARVPSGSSGGSSGPFNRGNIPLRTVRGITVHADVADNLEALLDAASADGIELSGWGFRDPEDQWRLRRQNCPNAATSSPSSCRPPTARPGQSMHEQGRAVDFTYGGRTIQSRSSPAFQWLAANAGRYGFHNLPSEPWHWSTNGN